MDLQTYLNMSPAAPLPAGAVELTGHEPEVEVYQRPGEATTRVRLTLDFMDFTGYYTVLKHSGILQTSNGGLSCFALSPAPTV